MALRDVAARLLRRREPDEAFLATAYRALLGRAPDDAGRQEYLQALRRGLGRDQVLLSIATSDEHRTRVATDVRREFPLRIVEREYHGVPLCVCIADPIGAEWYDVEWPEVPEIAFLAEHRLSRGATVFDLGAHQGVMALLLAHAVGEAGRVVAVEANPFNVGVAEVNRRLNGAPQLQLLHAAAAGRSGEIRFGRGGNGQVDPGDTRHDDSITVPAVTVDELADRHGPPDVLFVDVEGYELEVLRGARRTLDEVAPDCHVEVHVGVGLESFGASADELIETFAHTGHDLYISDEIVRQPRPLTSELMPLTRQRFFLTAISRRRPGVPPSRAAVAVAGR